MRLIAADNIYVLEGTRFQDRNVPRDAKFRWNPENKLWWTGEIENAIKLSAYAEDELRKKFNEYLQQKQVNIKESQSSDAEIDLPVPQGLSYLPYQRAGIAYGMKRKTVLLGDDMGLGKTIQAIGICNTLPEAKKILIICPASLKINWKREFTKWDVFNRTCEVADSKMFPMADVVILNYNILKNHYRYLYGITWDVLIVDEAHYLKNPKAKRTMEIFGGAKVKDGSNPSPKIEANYKIFITGTPIPNRPAEAWTLCHNLAPEVFPSWKGFMTRYAGAVQTQYGWDTSGSSNLSELQEKMRNSIMVRRLKSEVLKELPSKRRQIIELSGDGLKALVRKELAAYQKYEDTLIDLSVEVELAKAEHINDYENAIKRLEYNASLAFEEMSAARHELAISKIPFAIDHIKDSLEGGKVIVFAHHVDILKKIHEAFPGSVMITGEVSMTKRQKAVDSFQNDPSVVLILCNIIAAGVGLTLTASSHVIFVESDWVPGNVTQAEDRSHRYGQVNPVLIQHLVVEGSLDVKMVKTIIEKQEIISAALDNFGSFEYSLPEKIESEDTNGTLIPGKVVKSDKNSPAGIAVIGKPATSALDYDQVAEEATAMASNHPLIKLVHEGLKILSAYCDGALELDNMGFNKFDTGIGHKLARLPYLSPKQAVLGRKLVLKYKRQLPEEMIATLKKPENMEEFNNLFS